MATSLLLQYLVIALAVLASAGVVAHKQFPGVTRRLRARAASWLLREGRPHALQRVGRAVAPPAVGVAGSCGGCNRCGDD